MEFLGLGNLFSDLLSVFIKITINTIVFFVKTTVKGFIKFLFDALRYVEAFLDHIEHLFKR